MSAPPPRPRPRPRVALGALLLQSSGCGRGPPGGAEGRRGRGAVTRRGATQLPRGAGGDDGRGARARAALFSLRGDEKPPRRVAHCAGAHPPRPARRAAPPPPPAPPASVARVRGGAGRGGRGARGRGGDGCGRGGQGREKSEGATAVADMIAGAAATMVHDGISTPVEPPPPPAREGSAPPRPIPRRLTARRAPPRRWTWSSSACSFSGRRATAAPCSLSPPRRHPVRAPAHAPPAARPREGTERAVRDGFFVCGGQIWRAEGLRAFYVSYPTTLAMNIPARPAPAPPRSARRTAPR